MGGFHDVVIDIGRGVHRDEGDFRLFRPVVIANEKRTHLILRIAYGFQNDVVQIQEGSFGVDLNDTLEVIYFI